MFKFSRPLFRQKQQVLTAARCISDHFTKNLLSVDTVKIPEGKCKYLLVEIYIHGESATSRKIVRGDARAKCHIDLYTAVQNEINSLDLCTQCLGGGYIERADNEKKIKVYGKSLRLGKADHSITKSVLRDKYQNYTIEAEKGEMEA